MITYRYIYLTHHRVTTDDPTLLMIVDYAGSRQPVDLLVTFKRIMQLRH